ncbi:MAG: DEAD/DEAH box helicase family protein [Cardiobacteriaceae bacterium]|nr:DEAD/DEAH box helicase family protein [Cardiobacteriaceae bacterium]
MDYLNHEPQYKALYQKVLRFSDWVAEYKPHFPKNDTGIDLVAQQFDGTFTAIQCKNYAETTPINKADIDSFLSASSKTDFQHRLIITTSNKWSSNAENALKEQSPPVHIINRADLENSQIEWGQYKETQTIVLKSKKLPRPHQEAAIQSVLAKFKSEHRGKLIMACGTGKTFTALKIAEEQAGKNKTVLFLVPSLALLSQSLTEWTQQSVLNIRAFAVCSDSNIGQSHQEDSTHTQIHELSYPATTDAKALFEAIQQTDKTNCMTVIFSTYHSIEVIHQAQKLGLNEIDLVICDEAHRTTGATYDGEDESHFVRIHHQDYIQATKRLYMTATPKIYKESATHQDGVDVYSMDNKALFGETFYTLSFSAAVQKDLLVDYKVIVLTIPEASINRQLEKLLNDEGNELKVDDAAKIVGCWKALAKYGLSDNLADDSQPMKRAVAFCQVIDKYSGIKHKVSSKKISRMFNQVVQAYQAQEITLLKSQNQYDEQESALQLICEAEHIDGSMNASEKTGKINWLKEKTDNHVCRILSNVRCLSEGVDVPALDAVMFLSPRNSHVDVVQSVGRVMRKAEGKKRGYVILPVVIPAGIEPHIALNDNERFKVIWEVLNALKSHDDRFDAMLNKLEFGAGSDKIEIVAMADITRPVKSDNHQTKTGPTHKKIQKKEKESKANQNTTKQYALDFGNHEIVQLIQAKIVKKCGNRLNWQEWAENVAQIANTHVDRIKAILENPDNKSQQSAFHSFVQRLKQDLNTAVTHDDAIDMLAQHMITKPIFEALFSDSEFAKHNPLSIALDAVIEALSLNSISDKETEELHEFYEAIKVRVSGIKDHTHRQFIIKELYDKFFQSAFPKIAQKLGIVYTPIEVVDFIIHSIDYLLKKEFNSSLADKGVHIIDPFIGTGTFITRLLQSGLLGADPKALKEKYKEIHANEMLLLAYYIATINIESVYHSIVVDDYTPFEGICLADSFAMYEQTLYNEHDNSQRQKRQKELDITVIMGNPPYSAGQESANDNNANLEYPLLDKRIEFTYDINSTARLRTSLYDSYIRAIRWATDRIGNQGIIGFVTNGGYLDSNSADGLRKCLAEEFSSLYIFHLRGNARTSGERRRKEKDNIFGQGTRTPVAISLLVKNPNAKQKGKIYFYDIGDYLTREQKLAKIETLKSIEGIEDWQTIIPDEFNDWLNKRDQNFDKYILIGSKDKKDKNKQTVFTIYSRGIMTCRDTWAYNFSQSALAENMASMIEVYNSELNRFNQSNTDERDLENFLSMDTRKISWSGDLIDCIRKKHQAQFSEKLIRTSLYRPFTKQYLYFSSMFNNSIYRISDIFPTPESENLVIYTSGNGNSGKDFSVIMTNIIPDLNMQHSGGQGFPLYLYEKVEPKANDLFGQSALALGKYKRQDAITDEALKHFQDFYKTQDIHKESIFYYIYGLLHSEEYREKYADNLSKQLPRIPRVKALLDFETFENAGRSLAKLHVDYETVALYQSALLPKAYQIKGDKIIGGKDEDFYVEKMRFGKVRNPETGKLEEDKTVIIYNQKIKIENIPLEAYEYIVNGKSAIEWIMERQSIKTDRDSGIINNANLWASETMHNPRYPLELLLRVINLSLSTQEIVRRLPKLDLEVLSS